ncbi:MAG: hypothetical protein KC912_22690 [Proteobacteria bacterium]|nr:hypothetical protein [Pseudomonadota bacterium]
MALEFETSISAEEVDAAVVELAAAMIQRNDLYSQHRWVPGRNRTKRMDRVLAGFAALLCALGVALSLVLWALSPATGAKAWVAFLFLALFGGLGVASVLSVPLRRGVFAAIDRLIRFRARRLLGPMRAAGPLVLRYAVSEHELAGSWMSAGEAVREWSVALDGLTVACLGAHCVALFKAKRSQTPSAVILLRDPAVLSELSEVLRAAGMTEQPPISTEQPRNSPAYLLVREGL